MRALTITWLSCLVATTAHAQELPSRVRVLHPSCTGPIAWPVLEEALRVELRSMGTDLDRDEAGDVPARLFLDGACTREATQITATLVHAPSGRSITERIELGGEGDRVRVLAVGLSELLRSRWPSLLVDPAPPEPPPVPIEEPPVVDPPEIDRRILRAEIDRALASEPAPDPPALPEGAFWDFALGVSAYPAATHATAELRAGASFPLGGIARLGLELTGGVGTAADPLGDVALYGAGLAASLRAAHLAPDLVVEVGPRVDAGWARARGIPASDGVRGASLDAAHVAIGADLRARARLDSRFWILAGAEIGYSLVGIDARSDTRRVTAQIGPRMALSLGLSWL